MEEGNEFELEVVSVRLVRDASILSETKLHTAEDVIHLVGKELCGMDREVMCVINLKADQTPINCHFASVGALNYAVVNPRELLKASILSNAANIILCHNHPSGDLTPSRQDVQLTHQMQQVCGLAGIPLLDHVIVGGDNSMYFSFQEKGLVKNPCVKYQSDYRRLEWDSPSKVAERGEEDEVYGG